MSTIGFVSTTVLESKDGIDYGEEKRIESDEVKDAERRALEASRRPLWEQLQERENEKAKKDESIRKAIFSPPKELDEEEIEFLENLEQSKKEAKKKATELEKIELDLYASKKASLNKSSTAGSQSKTILRRDHGEESDSEKQDTINIKVRKRKIQKNSKQKGAKKKDKVEKVEENISSLVAEYCSD